MTLINFSNQLAAGPKNIAINFINELIKQNNDNYVIIIPSHKDYLGYNDTSKIKFIFVEVGKGFLGKVYKTIRINKIIIPKLIKEYNINVLLAFGNFLLTDYKGLKKIVLLHHPHLINDELYSSFRGVAKLSEWLKRTAFKKTVSNVDNVVVQSEYMKKMFLNKYPSQLEKIKLIHNPISSSFLNHRKPERANNRLIELKDKTIFKLIYVSRFYPHKNHEFLLALSDKFLKKNINIEILVTIDKSLPNANIFLDEIKKRELSIINIGELSQNELVKYYSLCDIMLFPSNAETFGNPLIEAMLFSLPIVAPNKDYAKALMGGKGVYYKSDSPSDCFNKVLNLLSNENKYFEYSKYCFDKSFDFPSVNKWVEEYKYLIKN